MCLGCEMAPLFAQIGASAPLSRRAVIRNTLAVAAAATVASACSTPKSSQGPIASSDGKADFVFRNGPMYTVTGDDPWAAKGLAVSGDKISYVGDEAGAMALAGPNTKVVDLKGGLLMPGFVEAHCHPFVGSFLDAGVNLQVADQREALAAIETFARDHPEGVVRGFGWRMDMFGPGGPTKEALDKIVPDRPVILYAIDAHSLWVNTKTLETAKITRDHPDPVPGFSYYTRDSKGNATGFVMETGAIIEILNKVDPVTPDSLGEMLRAWGPKASAAGITTLFDAGVPPLGGDQSEMIRQYTDLESQGALPFRVSASFLVPSGPALDAVDKLTALHKQFTTDQVSVSTLKMLGDGTPGGYTSWLIDPYADKPDSIGESPFTLDEWQRLINEADKAGFDVHVHACGERATRVALDCFEKAMADNPPRDRRNTITHLVYVEDVDNPRFGKLGVTAQFSGNWMSADPDTLITDMERYGRPRGEKLYRPRDVLKTGGRISFGSDWPAAGYYSTYKPLEAIEVSVTRQLIGKPDAPVLSPVDQRLTVAEAVRAATMGGAYQLRMDDKVGSLETGKLADLIVLDANIFEAKPHDIHKSNVTMTLMNGRVTHQV